MPSSASPGSLSDGKTTNPLVILLQVNVRYKHDSANTTSCRPEYQNEFIGRLSGLLNEKKSSGHALMKGYIKPFRAAPYTWPERGRQFLCRSPGNEPCLLKRIGRRENEPKRRSCLYL